MTAVSLAHSPLPRPLASGAPTRPMRAFLNRSTRIQGSAGDKVGAAGQPLGNRPPPSEGRRDACTQERRLEEQTEAITASQPSAAEPGGEMGRLDPTAGSGEHASRGTWPVCLQHCPLRSSTRASVACTLQSRKDPPRPRATLSWRSTPRCATPCGRCCCTRARAWSEAARVGEAGAAQLRLLFHGAARRPRDFGTLPPCRRHEPRCDRGSRLGGGRGKQCSPTAGGAAAGCRAGRLRSAGRQPWRGGRQRRRRGLRDIWWVAAVGLLRRAPHSIGQLAHPPRPAGPRRQQRRRGAGGRRRRRAASQAAPKVLALPARQLLPQEASRRTVVRQRWRLVILPSCLPPPRSWLLSAPHLLSSCCRELMEAVVNSHLRGTATRTSSEAASARSSAWGRPLCCCCASHTQRRPRRLAGRQREARRGGGQHCAAVGCGGTRARPGF